MRNEMDDLVIIGAGIVGAACAYYAAKAGLSVTVIEQGSIASGTSSRGEGNLLVSDKEAGPELDLALYSERIWRTELAEYAELWEYEPKGGLVVARSQRSLATLHDLAQEQRQQGIEVELLEGEAVFKREPHLNRSIAGAAYYPQDAQVQPILVTTHLLRLAREAGARVFTMTTVTGFLRSADKLTGVRTTAGDFAAANVINAAGTWAAQVAELAGVQLPVLPRRGFVLVTEPLPPTVRHKVYAAEYVGDVASSQAALQTSPVVEGTPSGTILIGASRERVGFDDRLSVPVISALARNAIELFPVLGSVMALRTYWGYRPYCPDHLPVIGADSRAPGLWHACGHEGAGIGLSVGTARLLVQALLGIKTDLDLSPFAVERFEEPA
ncbi:NAD(P)/FAD-dependent oxidoreductase [Psychromicrobium lacuslunae]|uniref:FAD-dependent oxidoreductase n=1 Tax=Psychromicrobium lacuslunae TaxID=1618207 RepID=A0A0D4C1Q1_9MICC|nr:FAD-dependent oxidoreductase [Psychromicrobium lacuslunae]AJT42291.1 FAD-dependent oxidoreductase [Psychromicrobium lacuslunae]